MKNGTKNLSDANPISRDPSLRVTLIGAVANFLLTVMKITMGIIGHSTVLTVDGIHSLSDLFTDGVTYAGRRWALQPGDRDHPYGHGRIETIASLLLGLFLIALALYFAMQSVKGFLDAEQANPAPLTLVVAGISIVTKEILYRITVRVGHEIRSDLILANAWHHRSDALSSIVAFLGILFSRLGIPGMDPLAALVVVLMVGQVGFTIFLNSFKNLADTMVEPVVQENIRSALLSASGARGFHDFRTRRVGNDIWVDVHLLVSSEISVSEGHHIAERARNRVLSEIQDVKEVLVHIDPEGGSDSDGDLMDRQQLMEEMKRELAGVIEFDQIERVTIDYHRERIHLTLCVTLPHQASIEDASRMGSTLRERILTMEGIESVQIDYSPQEEKR